MLTIPCSNCTTNHKCGIVCNSRKCLDEKCGCSVEKIEKDLLLCNTCELIIENKIEAFEKYYHEIELWYDSFYEEYKLILEEFQISLFEDKNNHNYNIVKQFFSAKSNFSTAIPASLKLETFQARKCAYELINAFNELKNMKL